MVFPNGLVAKNVLHGNAKYFEIFTPFPSSIPHNTLLDEDAEKTNRNHS